MRKILRIFLLLSGAAIMTLGLMRGEASEIFEKARIICLECIGIG